MKLHTYTVSVLDDQTKRTTAFEIRSPKKLDERLLQLCGLILDEGIGPEELRRDLPTAHSYVKVDGNTEIQDWINDAIKALI